MVDFNARKSNVYFDGVKTFGNKSCEKGTQDINKCGKHVCKFVTTKAT